MDTAVVLFTRDLRVHDHPAFAAACDEAERVVPLFVFDDAIWSSGYPNPNRARFLVQCVDDLNSRLRDRGGQLFRRRGELVAQVRDVVNQTGAEAVFLSEDVSGYAKARVERLRDGLEGVEVRTFPGITVVAPAELATSTGGPYKVFTPYWRAWKDRTLRPVLDAPGHVRVPTTIPVGQTPQPEELVVGEPSPELPRGGETAGLERLDSWLDGDIDGYHEGHDDLPGDVTSRLSPYLHFGCLSPRAIVERCDRGSPGAGAFVRQVCWRDYHHQVLAAYPEVAWEDYRTQGDRWRGDEVDLKAWKEGRTGYPIVDAGMRQLAREGWMHNRAPLTVALFWTRDLYLDWRAGARHFLDLLVDGDLANNQMNWQWVVGTGTISRRNRTFNPLRQAERFDPDGEYVRRYVPELAGIAGAAIHKPWELDDDVRAGLDYPDPIVDHAEALERFRQARGLN
ncbi:MAG: cryptochrome/photolyase family protein [Egibacteraceae bacterium]